MLFSNHESISQATKLLAVRFVEIIFKCFIKIFLINNVISTERKISILTPYYFKDKILVLL